MTDCLGKCEIRTLAALDMTLNYHTFVVPQNQKGEWSLRPQKAPYVARKTCS